MYNEVLEVELHDDAPLSIDESKHEQFGKPEEILALLKRHNKIGVWRFDIKSGDCFWTPEVSEIHGIEHVSGPIDVQRALCFYHDDDVETVQDLVKAALKTGQGYRFVLRLRRDDDNDIRLVESICETRKGPDGKVYELFGTFRDVTDERRKELKSNRQRDLINTIIQHVPAAFAVFDDKMRYIAVNKRWLEDFNHADETSLLGKSHYDVSPHTPERWRAEHQEVRKGAVVSSKSERLKRHDGKEITINRTLAPWKTLQEGRNGVLMMCQVVAEHDAPDPSVSKAVLERQAPDQIAGKTASLLDNVPHGLVIIDMREDRILFANRASSKALGVPQTRLVGRPLSTTIRNPDVLTVIRQSLIEDGAFNDVPAIAEFDEDHRIPLVVSGRRTGAKEAHQAVLAFATAASARVFDSASKQQGDVKPGDAPWWRKVLDVLAS